MLGITCEGKFVIRLNRDVVFFFDLLKTLRICICARYLFHVPTLSPDLLPRLQQIELIIFCYALSMGVSPAIT